MLRCQESMQMQQSVSEKLDWETILSVLVSCEIERH